MGKEGTQNWKGISGKNYLFEKWAINTNFDEIECVYIYTKLVAVSWKAIYVGQTEHLATRHRQHETGNNDSDKCIQKSGATHLHVFQLKPESARRDVETDLLKGYTWTCNKQ
jgi:predicted GIY-YIG superfamily endonuclease